MTVLKSIASSVVTAAGSTTKRLQASFKSIKTPVAATEVIRQFNAPVEVTSSKWWDSMSGKKRKEYLDAHPHSQFMKDADQHLADRSDAPETNPSYQNPNGFNAHDHSAHSTKDQKTHTHQVVMDAKGVGNDVRHGYNTKKTEGIHKLAKKHGFIKQNDRVYTHPKSGARLVVNQPSQQFYTDRHAGYSLTTPKDKLEEKASVVVAADDWFAKMTKRDQKQYIEDHPRSKYAKQAPKSVDPVKKGAGKAPAPAPELVERLTNAGLKGLTSEQKQRARNARSQSLKALYGKGPMTVGQMLTIHNLFQEHSTKDTKDMQAHFKNRVNEELSGVTSRVDKNMKTIAPAALKGISSLKDKALSGKTVEQVLHKAMMRPINEGFNKSPTREEDSAKAAKLIAGFLKGQVPDTPEGRRDALHGMEEAIRGMENVNSNSVINTLDKKKNNVKTEDIDFSSSAMYKSVIEPMKIMQTTLRDTINRNMLSRVYS